MKNALYLIVIQTIASLRGNRDPPDGSKLALHQAEQKLYVAIKERELANSIGLKNASNKQKIAKGTMCHRLTIFYIRFDNQVLL